MSEVSSAIEEHRPVKNRAKEKKKGEQKGQKEKNKKKIFNCRDKLLRGLPLWLVIRKKKIEVDVRWKYIIVVNFVHKSDSVRYTRPFSFSLR